LTIKEEKSASRQHTSSSSTATTSEYNPSEVFLSWLNEGLAPRPKTSAKIRLTYSRTTIANTAGKFMIAKL